MDHRPVNPIDPVGPLIPQARASLTSSVALPLLKWVSHGIETVVLWKRFDAEEMAKMFNWEMKTLLLKWVSHGIETVVLWKRFDAEEMAKMFNWEMKTLVIILKQSF
ncbi:hypothetical protein C1H46_019019 [Malus baccata]|uniref:Uncharacterized protein n=1 Tax=Malus baccata TaxID=106549 RepID=A0A540M9H9_MALBA|nr:hypothetical protein C1H46_019019 [Malus baccata]